MSPRRWLCLSVHRWSVPRLAPQRIMGSHADMAEAEGLGGPARALHNSEGSACMRVPRWLRLHLGPADPPAAHLCDGIPVKYRPPCARMAAGL